MNFKPIIPGLIAGVVYIVVSEILPDWKHVFAGLFGGVVYIAAYYLLPTKLGDKLRIPISVLITIIIAYTIKLVS